MRRLPTVFLILGITLFECHPQVIADEDGLEDVLKPPPFEQFLVIPLRIHILSATDLPEIDCHLGDADVHRILGKANRIWNVAGIHWGLESIVREPAARQECFREKLKEDTPPDLFSYRMLLPEMSRNHDGLHVYYLHKFAVNGVWLGGDFALVQETAKLKAVEGGIDEPIPRVTSHELGHALGLPHRQNRTNLLASGTTGTKLNSTEVKTARETAKGKHGAKTVADLKIEARKTEDQTKASRIWNWLGEIPGVDDEPGLQLKRIKGAVESAPEQPSISAQNLKAAPRASRDQ